MIMGNLLSPDLFCQAEFAKEIHALSSAAKPVATWFGVEALDEARKACGGHGYDTFLSLQVHRAQLLSIAYAEHTIIQWAVDAIREIDDPRIVQVPVKLQSV
ncbi:hypothetical protein ANCCEY_05673 [Ancylostoma ceylanicum]|uniref:Acyl-CoA oxidase C-alpha1 domain-containing protein n=1 Tax=Ancylostoma ceylanicum TaxID=53326 RepID=A0A0D6LTW2_9BILA|nr:hypothetical protein ANCCEY_05673 [Ancylostoma ceylanicum]